VLTKNHIFFKVMLCWLVKSYRCFREAQCLHSVLDCLAWKTEAL
jgi:hypothetical protein